MTHFTSGVLQNHKWENAMTIDKQSWGHRANAKLEDFLTSKELIKGMIALLYHIRIRLSNVCQLFKNW